MNKKKRSTNAEEVNLIKKQVEEQGTSRKGKLAQLFQGKAYVFLFFVALIIIIVTAWVTGYFFINYLFAIEIDQFTQNEIRFKEQLAESFIYTTVGIFIIGMIYISYIVVKKVMTSND